MKLLKYCLGIPLFFAYTVNAQQAINKIEVSGKVTNSAGEALVNANVTTKNGRGTVTNSQGRYSLKNVNPDDELQISFIGYSKQTIPVKNQTTINVTLFHANNELDRVVVQAYGQTSQRLTTGNISKISSEEINRQPLMNPIQAIQGLAAGTVVTNTSGFASGTVKIEIRGRKTINPNIPSDPLYVIDGVPLTVLPVVTNNSSNYQNGSQGFIQSGIASPANGQSPFFSLNPSDIESIEVLKDADATAIYGSRAANGVIIITTKKGTVGKTKFELNANTGISRVISNYAMLNTQQYVEMRKEALNNDNRLINLSNSPDLTAWDTTRFTDWQDYVWGKTGRALDIDASISGGDTRTWFRLGAGYHSLTEITAATGSNKRGSLTFSFGHKTKNEKLVLGLSAQYSNALTNMRYLSTSVTYLPPNAPAVYDTRERLNYLGWQPLSSLFAFGYIHNPYTASTNFLNTSLNIRYEIVKGLQLSTNLGYNSSLNTQKNATTIASQNPLTNPKGRAEFGNTIFHNTLIEPQLEYSTYVNKNRLSILFGGSFQINKTNSNYSSGQGYSNDALLESISNAATQNTYAYSGTYKYAAIFGRFNYSFKEKYVANLNVRRDGSSRFGPGRQYGNFGSAGLGWIFSKESWMKEKVPFISFGKIRASYGKTGSDQIGDYSFLTNWQFIPNPYNGSQLLRPTRHTDSLLHWQENIKKELGLELGLIHDRIFLNVSWYQEQTNDQLVNFPTPIFTGFSNVISNSPAKVGNKGWEIVLNTQNIETKNLKWKSKFIIAFNRNKLLAYPNLDQSPYAGIFAIGKPLNIQKVLRWTGVDPQTGLYTFEDKNKNNSIDYAYDAAPDDSYYIDINPKFDGSLSNSLTFKNWDLSFLFYFKNQKGRNALVALNTPGTNYNQPVEVLTRWQKPGDMTSVAKFTTNPNADISYTNFRQRSDALYTNASFIRLQNLAIAYNFSQRILKATGLTTLRAYVQAENVFVITKYKGIDPEVQNFGGLPRAKVIVAGISVNF